MVINKYVVMMLKKELVSGECMRGIIFVSTECLFFLLSFIFLYFRSTSISLRIIYMKERKSTKMKSHMSCIINEAMILLCVFIDHLLFFSFRVFTWEKNIFSSLVKWIEPFPIDEIPPIFIWPEGEMRWKPIISSRMTQSKNCSQTDWSDEIYYDIIRCWFTPALATLQWTSR